MRAFLISLMVFGCGAERTQAIEGGSESESEAEAESESESESEGETGCTKDPRFGTECDGEDDDACPDGIYVCNAEGTAVVCNDDLISWNIETCNGKDDDCDGIVDELPDLGDGYVWCGGDVGVCSAAYVTCGENESFECVMPANYEGVELSCADGADNDCDGLSDLDDPDCEGCGVITTPEGDEMAVSGMPEFALSPDSPTGVAVPGLVEVLRYTISVDGGCSGVNIYSLTFRATYTDNASSGWMPNMLRLHYLDEDGIEHMRTTFGVAEGAGVMRYEFSFTSPMMFIPAGFTGLQWVVLDTTGASAATDDTVRLSLEGPIEVITADDGTIYEMEIDPIEGSTLTF